MMFVEVLFHRFKNKNNQIAAKERETIRLNNVWDTVVANEKLSI